MLPYFRFSTLRMGLRVGWAGFGAWMKRLAINTWLLYSVSLAIYMHPQPGPQRNEFVRHVLTSYARTLLLSWACKDPLMAAVRASLPTAHDSRGPRTKWLLRKLGGSKHELIS